MLRTLAVMFMSSWEPSPVPPSRRLALAAAAATVTLMALLAPSGDAARSSSAHFNLRGTVVRVVDGDTIDVRLSSGTTERVRMIGVDSPERGRCYAARATAQTVAMTLRKSVGLLGDRTQARRDRFGRLLAYVSAPRRPDVGRRLLEGGFAQALVVGRPFQRVSSYRRYQRGAQSADAACGQRAATPTRRLHPHRRLHPRHRLRPRVPTLQSARARPPPPLPPAKT